MDQKPPNMLQEISFNDSIDLIQDAAMFISQANINLLQPYDRTKVYSLLLDAPKFQGLVAMIRSVKSKNPNLEEKYRDAIENRFGSKPIGGSMLEIFELMLGQS